MTLDTFTDDDDLPALPEKPEQPREKATGRFQPKGPSPDHFKPDDSHEEKPVAHKHSPYFLAVAKQFGLTDEEISGTPPAVLEKWAADRTARQPETPKEKPPETEPEDTIDWGEDDEGKPLTEEQARKLFSKPVFNAIKNSHRVEKLEKENAKLRGEIDADRQERSKRAVLRQLNTVFATRPDLFGEKPGQAQEGTVEFDRYQLALQHIDRLLATKKATSPEQDAKAAMALFGPAPGKATEPPGSVKRNGTNGHANGYSLADYARAEVQPPTARRNDEKVSKRDARIAQKRAELREQGYQFSSNNPLVDDDDDLPE